MSHTLFVTQLSNTGHWRDETIYALTGEGFSFSFFKLRMRKAFSVCFLMKNGRPAVTQLNCRMKVLDDLCFLF